MSGSRKKRPMRPFILLSLLSALWFAAGCSTANTPGGESHIDASGKSVSGWLVVPSGGSHSGTATREYSSGSVSCAQCHGADLSGGISNVSCFSDTASGCHHVTGSGAPVWGNPQAHGAAAKKAPGSSGFVSCQICHGKDFSGGGAKVSCFTCHEVNAPHPAQPWRGSPYTHTNVDNANVSVCAQCHFPGSPNNPANQPTTPAPAGTPPGCFNNTLCHGENPVPHPVGSAWVAASPAAQPHGVIAKATPGATAGYAYCQSCHGAGTNFAGGLSEVSCYPCHVPTANSPHASQWQSGNTYAHTSTAAGNATVCAYCHLNGANSPIAAPSPPAPPGTAPGCFNSTLCHGASAAPHPVPYNDNSHYTVTSATFPGSCSACHDVSLPSTKVRPVCQACHVAASPLAAANCTSCHASPPNGGAPAGAVYANIAGAHAVHIALTSAGTPISCDTCHNGLGPSLLNTNHYDRAKSRVLPGDVAFLPTYNANSGASSFSSAGLSCSNVSCHGGKATPDWQTGAINVSTQCTSCHTTVTTSQFNGPTSGNHNRSDHQVPCTICHNPTTLAVNHFTNLGTPALEGPASATIGGSGTAITSWNPTTKSCTPACHDRETW